MRYEKEHYENTWFETGNNIKVMPTECQVCLQKIGGLANTYENFQLKNKLNFAGRIKYGVAKWETIKTTFDIIL